MDPGSREGVAPVADRVVRLVGIHCEREREREGLSVAAREPRGRGVVDGAAVHTSADEHPEACHPVGGEAREEEELPQGDHGIRDAELRLPARDDARAAQDARQLEETEHPNDAQRARPCVGLVIGTAAVHAAALLVDGNYQVDRHGRHHVKAHPRLGIATEDLLLVVDPAAAPVSWLLVGRDALDEHIDREDAVHHPVHP